MNKLGKILFSKEEIENKVKDIANKIDDDYQGKEISFIVVLKGSFIFASDLIKNIKTNCEIDFLATSSFEGTSSTGQVQIKKDLDISIESKHVIIIENIVNTGLTLNYLKKIILARNPASVKIVSLLERKANRVKGVQIDYSGFQIRDDYLVGYGLDINQKFRNLEEIRNLEKVRK